MQAIHEATERDGREVDVLRCGSLQIALARQGAELFSLRLTDPDGSGTGFLYRDGELSPPPEGWANHATVMGYFVHRLWQEQSSYEGTPVKGGNHGFLRHFPFEAPTFDREAKSLSYHVPASRIPPSAYPLRVSCTITYRIVGSNSLAVEFLFCNEEPARTAHLSFGLHPGFAVTSLEQAGILLPPGTYRRLVAPGNFLNGESEIMEHAGGAMPFAKSGLPGSYLLDLRDVPRRFVQLLDPPSGRRVTLALQDCPYLTLWSEGNDYVCLEPCWGMPDSNPPVDFARKVGIQTIDPGRTLAKSFLVTTTIQPPDSSQS
jgi:galactose mutarotase-like enzyme